MLVCGVDRSRQAWSAAQLASVLARRLGLDLELVHVTDTDDDDALSHARSLRTELCRDLDRADLPLRLETGPVAERLIAVAAERAAALVIGTRGEGALRRALLGSVSAAVTRRPPVPVIVVPPGAVDPHGAPLAGGGIVCGVRDPGDAAVAEAAARMAAPLGLTLTLVHVAPLPQAPVSAAGGAPPALLSRRTADEVASARAMLEELAQDVALDPAPHTRLRVLEGPIGPQLARVADLEDAALVALGASERGALAAALAGSPSEHVMRRGSQPVMVCPR
jgi:nucleotide-binding universal stress UspA family protein